MGSVTGSVRIRHDGEPDAVECALERFRNMRHEDSARLIDAKLGGEPVVFVSKIQLLELYLEDQLSPQRSSLGALELNTRQLVRRAVQALVGFGHPAREVGLQRG